MQVFWTALRFFLPEIADYYEMGEWGCSRSCRFLFWDQISLEDQIKRIPIEELWFGVSLLRFRQVVLHSSCKMLLGILVLSAMRWALKVRNLSSNSIRFLINLLWWRHWLSKKKAELFVPNVVQHFLSRSFQMSYLKEIEEVYGAVVFRLSKQALNLNSRLTRLENRKLSLLRWI